MKRLMCSVVVVLVGLSATQADAQGCRGSGGGGGGTSVPTAVGSFTPTISPYSTAYRQPQYSQGYSQQQQQMQQAYLQHYWAMETKKAERKEADKQRKLAYRIQRREAEIARRNGARSTVSSSRAPNSTPSSQGKEPIGAIRAFGA